MKNLSKKAAVPFVVAAALLSGAPSAGAATPGTAVSGTASCQASKYVFDTHFGGQLRANFSFRVNATVDSGNRTATVRSITYTFSNPRHDRTGTKRLGSKSNVNLPGRWNSPDNLRSSGTVNVPPFKVNNGGWVSVNGVPDVVDLPDPSCTTSAQLSWR